METILERINSSLDNDVDLTKLKREVKALLNPLHRNSLVLFDGNVDMLLSRLNTAFMYTSSVPFQLYWRTAPKDVKSSLPKDQVLIFKYSASIPERPRKPVNVKPYVQFYIESHKHDDECIVCGASGKELCAPSCSVFEAEMLLQTL